jgi:hypothetical protein
MGHRASFVLGQAAARGSVPGGTMRARRFIFRLPPRRTTGSPGHLSPLTHPQTARPTGTFSPDLLAQTDKGGVVDAGFVRCIVCNACWRPCAETNSPSCRGLHLTRGQVLVLDSLNQGLDGGRAGVVEYHCCGCRQHPGRCLGLWESAEAFSLPRSKGAPGQGHSPHWRVSRQMDTGSAKADGMSRGVLHRETSRPLCLLPVAHYKHNTQRASCQPKPSELYPSQP